MGYTYQFACQDYTHIYIISGTLPEGENRYIDIWYYFMDHFPLNRI